MNRLTVQTAAIHDDSATGLDVAILFAKHRIRTTLVCEDAPTAERLESIAKRAMAGDVDASGLLSCVTDNAASLSQTDLALSARNRGDFALSLPMLSPTDIPIQFHPPLSACPLIELDPEGLSNASREGLERWFSDLGKAVCFGNSTPEFSGQALLDAYQWAADILLTYHSTPWEIDEAMEDGGWGQGACLRQDQEGLEKAYHRRRSRQGDPRVCQVAAVDRAVKEGRLGRQIGWGWYRYPGGGGPVQDPLVEDLLEEEAWLTGIQRTALSADEISQRMRLAVLNKAKALVDSDRGTLPTIARLCEHLCQFPGGASAVTRALSPDNRDNLNTELERLGGPLIDPWTRA